MKTIKLIKNILIGISVLFLIGCEDTYEEYKQEATLTFDMRLPEDVNGYYHLKLNRNKWQTLHRISGSIREDEFGLENFWIDWESNLYWYIGDTLGYVVKRGLDTNLNYVSYDTVYVTGFNGEEVPTTNKTSFSNSRGEINNMIAPVQTMVGDTMKLTANWSDGSLDFYIVLD
jgi:hypothetical protein